MYSHYLGTPKFGQFRLRGPQKQKQSISQNESSCNLSSSFMLNDTRLGTVAFITWTADPFCDSVYDDPQQSEKLRPLSWTRTWFIAITFFWVSPVNKSIAETYDLIRRNWMQLNTKISDLETALALIDGNSAISVLELLQPKCLVLSRWWRPLSALRKWKGTA